MDPFELLKADHEKVADLFERLESSSGKAKLDVFKQIKNELEVHTHIEEKIFYPALERPEETHDITLEAYEEHAVVKKLLRELGGARTATDEWQAKVKVLQENVEHHVEEEENEMFDKAKDALESDQLDALGDRMAEEKARQQGQQNNARSQSGAKKSTKQPKRGVLSRIASFVGLGSGADKKAAKKSSSQTKKSGSKGSKKRREEKDEPKAAKKAVKRRTTKSATKTSAKKGRSSSSKTKKRTSTKKRR